MRTAEILVADDVRCSVRYLKRLLIHEGHRVAVVWRESRARGHVRESDHGNTCLTKEESGMAKYGKKAQSKVKRAMHERKHGTLKSGRSGKKVTSRKQAIAIGLSEAREAGAKVPRPRKAGSRKK